MISQISDEFKSQLMNDLAENLTVFRAKLGVTQTELAQRVGITKNTLNHIENKKREMTWVTFVALILLFLQKDDTKTLVEAFNLYPTGLEDFLLFNNKKS